jgi:hypothetical protein
MLRQLVSVSLAITACATLISTKANAVTLTAIPVNGLQRNPGDEMKFSLVLNPSGTQAGTGIRYFGILPGWNQDDSELSRRGLALAEVFNNVNLGSSGVFLNSTTTVATLTFDVLPGVVKDGDNDLFNVQAAYKEILGFSETGVVLYSEFKRASVSEKFDVEPVPEPLTMFSAAAALGYGAILKRKFSKNTES